MDIQNIKRDSGAISAGQWVSDIPEMGDLRLRVRGWTAPEASALRGRLERAVSRADRDRSGRINDAEAARITSRVLADVILLDWEGVTSGKKKVAYSEDLAREWLTNPDFRPFADAVAWASQAVDRGQADATEDAKGN